MPNTLVDTIWLRLHTDRVRGVLLHRSGRQDAWPVARLKAVLEDNGLRYSASEVAAIHAQLILDGILEPTP